MYDSLNGTVVSLGLNGIVEATWTLSTSGTYPQNIAFAPTGDTYAYILYDDPTSLNIAQPDATFEFPLPAKTTANSLAFYAGPTVFASDGQRLAFGFAMANGEWQIQIRDAASQWSSTATLNHTAPFPGLNPVDSVGRTPIVLSLAEDGAVTFVLAQPFSGYQTNFPTTYVWDSTTGNVAATNMPTALDGDTLSGEQLTVLFDEVLPNAADSFQYPQANALYYTDVDGESRLLFNTANLSMFWPRFIVGGELIMVGGFSPQNRISWLLLNRNGDVIGDFPPLQMSGLAGTPQGFVYTVDAGTNAGSILYHVTVTDEGISEPIELWNGPPGVSYRVIRAG